MPIIIGKTVNDITGLKILGDDPNKHEVVVIPGYISIKNPDKPFTELLEIASDYLTQTTALDIFEKQKNTILNGGYGKGKTLDITYSPIYDIIVKATGFNYKQLIRDLFAELVLKIEDVEEIEKMKRKLEVTTIDSLAKELKEDIEDAIDLLGDVSITVPKHTGKSSERSAVNQVAHELKIPVRVSDDGDYYTVTYKQDTKTHPKATGRGGMMTWNINQWLSTLTPMTPTEPPADIVSQCTDSYFRTVLNKSPYYASYRRGRVTVYPAGINDGQLYLGTTPLARISSHCTTEYLDMVLGPHGYTHTAVMGWERHTGGQS